jgi:hypothetical protein
MNIFSIKTTTDTLARFDLTTHSSSLSEGGGEDTTRPRRQGIKYYSYVLIRNAGKCYLKYFCVLITNAGKCYLKYFCVLITNAGKFYLNFVRRLEKPDRLENLLGENGRIFLVPVLLVLMPESDLSAQFTK